MRSETNRRPRVTVRSLLSTQFLVAIRATTRPRIMRSIRIGAATSGHGVWSDALTRQFFWRCVVPFTVHNAASNFDDASAHPVRGRDPLPVLITVDEAAALLRTTRRAIYAMIERRQLPGVIRI